MQTMNISLPGQLKDFVECQVGSGRYSTVSEYVRDLIRDDEKRRVQEKSRHDWSDIRTEALKQFEARKARNSA